MSSRSVFVALMLAAHVGGLPLPAWGQSSAKWEFEVDLGLISRANTLKGVSALEFPVGPTLGPSDGTGPSRAVSSWFFGDGTALFNQVNSLLGSPYRVSPLDAALQDGSTRRKLSLGIGVGVARWLTDRVAAEFNLDYSRSAVVFTNDALDTFEAARLSFFDSFNGLLLDLWTPDGTATDVLSGSDVEVGGGHQVFLTGGLKVRLYDSRSFRSYVGGGGGLVFMDARAPSATFVGAYSFSAAVPEASGIVPIVPFAEEDDVRIRVRLNKSRSPAGIVHGGLEYEIAPRRGFRLDVALYLFSDSVSTILDARPIVGIREPARVIGTATTPSLRFGNNPAVGPSSLSGPALSEVTTFEGRGTQAQVKMSAAYFFRF